MSTSPNPTDLTERVESYIAEVVIPHEVERNGVLHDADDDFRRLLQRGAADRGLLSPHVPEKWGGLGLNMIDRSPIFEAAGYSLFGPLALNCAAPDEGNMHLLDVVATDQQAERYLAPLASGEIRSCFAMTEPSPGAGSDPSLLRTTATRVDGGWLIRGRKWFITGAQGASFIICMARTSGDIEGTGGATMFLVDADNPGVNIERSIDTLDEAMIGGHGELTFTDCFVEDDAILGGVDEGFRYAQVRLAPARLTHCMRWLGLARRAHHIALDRALERRAFGAMLSDQGMIQHMIADNEIDLATSQAINRTAAEALDAGERAGHETSIAKTHVSEAVGRIVDRSLQICGALGISRDILLSRYVSEVRPFRIYDGPSETHRWSIARRAFRAAAARNQTDT